MQSSKSFLHSTGSSKHIATSSARLCTDLEKSPKTSNLKRLHDSYAHELVMCAMEPEAKSSKRCGASLRPCPASDALHALHIKKVNCAACCDSGADGLRKNHASPASLASAASSPPAAPPICSARWSMRPA